LIDEMTSDTNICLLVRAVEFAARKHRLQRRKDVDASPYINHPVALMSVLCVEADVCDVDVLCAAVLHDTIEDTETTRDELKQEFGKKIAGIVAEVTDDKSLPKEERKRLQVENAPHKSAAAVLVTIADKISNLRDVAANAPTGWSIERRRDYFIWAKAVVDGLPSTEPRLRELFEEIYARRP
jgi:GTP diphosphokinase / guanosine-3',5'-bis(diphosphate) 3'-diphosphatase